MSTTTQLASTTDEQSSTTTCLLTDDHRCLVKLLSCALEEHGMTMVGRVCDGHEAFTRIEAARPDVAILDIKMPGLNGVEVARQAARSAPETAILLYTGYGEDALINEALDVGVRGLVLKEASLDELMRAIDTVVAGGTYLDPVLGAAPAGSPSSPKLPLSKRVQEVLRLSADGPRYEEIGPRGRVGSSRGGIIHSRRVPRGFRSPKWVNFLHCLGTESK